MRSAFGRCAPKALLVDPSHCHPDDTQAQSCCLVLSVLITDLSCHGGAQQSMTDELRNAKAEVGAAHKQIAATVAALARADEMHALGTIDPSSGAAQGGLSVRGLTGLSGGIMGGYGGYGRGLTADSEAVWLNSLLAANWGGWLATWLSNLARIHPLSCLLCLSAGLARLLALLALPARRCPPLRAASCSFCAAVGCEGSARDASTVLTITWYLSAHYVAFM